MDYNYYKFFIKMIIDIEALKSSLERCDPEVPVTLEIRFGEYDNPSSGLSQSTFRRLQHTLEGTLNNKVLTTSFFNQNDKKTIKILPDSNELIEFSHKYCIAYIENVNYNLHFDICQFLDIPQKLESTSPGVAKPTENILTKNKNKTIYQLNDNNIELLLELSASILDDITEVWELKLKWTFRLQDFSILQLTDLQKLVEILLCEIHHTRSLYTSQQRAELILDINQALHTSQTDLLNPFVKVYSNSNFEFQGPYIVSAKAKGQRLMLVIHNTGVWLIHPKPVYQYNLIANSNVLAWRFTESWNLTIFDGELVTPINRTEYDFNYTYWYIAHDCLVFRHQDIRNSFYLDRIDYAKTFKSLVGWYINRNYLQFSLQTTRLFMNSTEMLEKIYYILNVSIVLNYQHDGLIFTPTDAPYDNDRTYKWLYPSSTTIDFAIYDSGHKDYIKLHVYNADLMKDQAFEGLPELPFNDADIQHDNFIGHYDGSKLIAECQWDKVLDKMVLLRIRTDKDEADSVELALENWKNMNNPFFDTMC